MVLPANRCFISKQLPYLKGEIEIRFISSFTISCENFLKEIRKYTMIN
jgi:hypothetical protein